MKDCDDYRTNIQLYFDEEACDKDLEEFRAHCRECATCEQAIDAERNLSRLLKSARPLYSAPDSLHKRVLALIHRPDPLLPDTPALLQHTTACPKLR
jgi:anti-sigma factor (TIGR02949 family)